jgi:hypothetical protein
MMVMKDDVFTIRLSVADRMYPLMIKRGDEREEFLAREAAKRVREYMTKYRQEFAESMDEMDLLAMTAIHLARDVSLQEERNGAKPFTCRIQFKFR